MKATHGRKVDAMPSSPHASWLDWTQLNATVNGVCGSVPLPSPAPLFSIATLRPVRLNLFRTTFQSWNSVFFSQHFSISISLSMSQI